MDTLEVLQPCLIQVMSKKLPHNMENVCLSTDEEANMYAVGSKGSTDLLDARTLQVTVMNDFTNSGSDVDTDISLAGRKEDTLAE